VVFLSISLSDGTTGDPRALTASPPRIRVSCSTIAASAPPVAHTGNSIEQMTKDAITFIKAMGFAKVGPVRVFDVGMTTQEIARGAATRYTR